VPLPHTGGLRTELRPAFSLVTKVRSRVTSVPLGVVIKMTTRLPSDQIEVPGDAEL
jgi:hypothetical protein